MRWLWMALMGRLGVKVRVFHLGDYRRQVLGTKSLPEDYFWAKATDETMQLRQQIMDTCRSDLLNFFDVEKGQVLRPPSTFPPLRSAPVPPSIPAPPSNMCPSCTCALTLMWVGGYL
jgi:6-phosphofructo-2-kinase